MKTFVFVYIAIVALALTSFSSVEAQTTQTKNPNLPEFEYNLTEKPLAERTQLCEQNKGHCQTDCGGPGKDPMNFCNATTMGWGCGCIDKVPDYYAYQWPVNFAHCVGSGEACKDACGEDKVPAQDKPKCNVACVEEWSQKCGTPDQPPAYYNVSDISVVPTYAPPTEGNKTSDGKSPSTDNKGTDGSSSNTTDASNEKKSVASSLSFHVGNTVFTLAIVAFGMSLL